VELEEGIGGMVHISDLSWTKRFSHPSEFTKIGNDIEVVILEIDKDHRKLSLGHKQIEENPWDTFENVFPIGSYHEATVVRRDDRGAIVQLPYGLEAFAPIKHVRKDDGKLANVDETLTVKVIEFNRDDKRILVSHLRYLEDIRREADESVRQEKQQVRKETTNAIQKQQSKVERTTLGELAGFDALKQQLAGDTVNFTPPPLKKDEATPEAVAEEAPVTEPVVNEVIEPVVEDTSTPAADESAGDDLKKIEGVGPKIESLMKEGGLKTWAAVAAASPESIKEILLAAGNRYKMHDPTTWPTQAGLALEGKWDELNKWQDEHKGGKL
jgi:predicted flap endonuclease-1-like 5' DNA nuclease/sRNA-binding carbon storage regulator CsrA